MIDGLLDHRSRKGGGYDQQSSMSTSWRRIVYISKGTAGSEEKLRTLRAFAAKSSFKMGSRAFRGAVDVG